jgi:iron(III) transport system substrate-binding protein
MKNIKLPQLWCRRSLLALGALSVAGLASLPMASSALAQGASPLAGLATYEGADRMQKLIEGAKKEGTVTFYTSAPVDDMKVITEAFEKKYGVKARLWRGSSENILQRVVVESRAGRYEADVIDTNGPEMEALHRENILQPVKSPLHSELMPQSIRPHGGWVGTRLNIFVSAFNTNLVKKEEIPQSYEGFLDPKWKGKLGIEAEDHDWFAVTATKLGEQKALQLFRDIAAKNGISVRKGHTLLTNLVVSGEVPLALTVYSYKAEQLKNDKAPIDWFSIPPAVARFNGAGVTKNAPHPHAAILFYDFMMREAQELLASRDFTPSNLKVKELPKGLEVVFVDPALILDEGQKWEKLWNDIIVKQSR